MSTPSVVYRIKRDIKLMMRDPPPGIRGVVDEHDLRTFHAVIVGPDGTPYEKGFFYFIVKFPNDYPLSPPDVKYMTTDAGRTRMNPNLYETGKVCLSILGTWPGPSWSPSQSLTSTLLSIQTLLNEKPYHNEPGHEVENDDNVVIQYNEVMMHETLRVAVIGMVLNEHALNMPIVLEQFIQMEFVKNYDFYVQRTIQKLALSGNYIEDPLFPRPGRSFTGVKLATNLVATKVQLTLIVV